MRLIAIMVTAVGLAAPAFANQSDFCAGFEMGWKTVKGNSSYVPYCPYEPYTPNGSTPYQEGLKRGIAAAAE